MAREVVPQFPDALRKWFEREQFEVELEQILVRGYGVCSRDVLR
jgi:hypothetical protein